MRSSCGPEDGARREKVGPWNIAQSAAGVHASVAPWIKARGVAFEAVAGTAAKLNRWEFMLTIAPVPVTGGTGSPLNALATF